MFNHRPGPVSLRLDMINHRLGPVSLRPNRVNYRPGPDRLRPDMVNHKPGSVSLRPGIVSRLKEVGYPRGGCRGRAGQAAQGGEGDRKAGGILLRYSTGNNSVQLFLLSILSADKETQGSQGGSQVFGVILLRYSTGDIPCSC